MRCLLSSSKPRSRCDNIRFQLDHFLATEQPGVYRDTLRRLRILIRFTPNRRERAAYQNILDEYEKKPGG